MGGVIIAAWGAGVLLTVLSHTWRIGAEANRKILITLSVLLCVVLLGPTLFGM